MEDKLSPCWQCESLSSTEIKSSVNREITYFTYSVLSPYVNSLAQSGILQGIPQSLSQFQPHCEVTFLATAENWIIFTVILDILYLEYRRSLGNIFRCAFRHFCRFLTLHFCTCMMSMVRDQHVHFKWHVFVTLFLIYALARVSSVYQVVFHSQCGLEVL